MVQQTDGQHVGRRIFVQPVDYQEAAQSSQALSPEKAQTGSGKANAQQNRAHCSVPPFQKTTLFV